MRISLERRQAVEVSLRNRELALRFRKRGTGALGLGFRFPVLGHGVIQLLLGDQTGAGFGSLFQSRVSRVIGAVSRLGTLNLALGTADRVLVAADVGFCARDLSVQFRDL